VVGGIAAVIGCDLEYYGLAGLRLIFEEFVAVLAWEGVLNN
jgi:hypothetical protein